MEVYMEDLPESRIWTVSLSAFYYNISFSLFVELRIQTNFESKGISNWNEIQR